MKKTLIFRTPIPITLPHCPAGEAEAICALLDAGAGVIHLRKPDATEAQTETLLRQLRDAGADLSRLTLHHDQAMAQRYGLGGIHLRECPDGHDTSPCKARCETRAETPPMRLSTPCHSWDEALRQAPLCDYILLSPLFDSISKPGYRSAIDPADACLRLREDSALTGHTVALGGIHAGNIALVRAAGFDGAAVLGAVWAFSATESPTDTETQSGSNAKTNPDTPGSDHRAASLQRIDTAATLRNFHILTRRWQAGAGTLQFISDGDLATAEAYLQGGGRWVQLRMKETPAEAIIARGREMLALCRRYDARLILNDNPSLCGAIGADGVHLGQGDMHPDEARKLLGEGAIIGCTANTFDQIARIAQSSADYIGLGPFRYTTTKKNLSPILGAEGYTQIMHRMAEAGIRLPVVAIGGIEIADVPQVMETGVNGIALSGAISHADDIAATTARFAEQIRRHRTVAAMTPIEQEG